MGCHGEETDDGDEGGRDPVERRGDNHTAGLVVMERGKEYQDEDEEKGEGEDAEMLVVRRRRRLIPRGGDTKKDGISSVTRVAVVTVLKTGGSGRR